MILKPYDRGPVARPVGLVVDDRTVIGEWKGTRWKDIPRKAALYCNSVRTLQRMYERGQLEKIWWKKDKRIGSLTGWRWVHPINDTKHTVYFLRNVLGNLSPEKQLAAVLQMVEFVRNAGGAPSSPVGMLNGLLRISLPDTLWESAERMPVDRIWRGSRVQLAKTTRSEYGPTDLWDLRSAFPTALRNVPVPRRWRRYEPSRTKYDPLPDTEAAYVRAIVHVPWMMYGPLPDIGLAHPNFPTETFVRGVWSLDELRVAEAVGCEIFTLEFWTGNSFRFPFRDWGAMVDELRASVDRDALGLVKMAANRYVGKFAMAGRRERSYMQNGTEYWIRERGRKRPDSLSIHGLVTSGVRAQVFAQGIHPFPGHFVFCHTDGVALQADEVTEDRHPPMESWRIKTYMERLLLINPQRYAYRPGAEDIGPGDWRYVIAGIPESAAEGFFERRWLKSARLPTDT